MATRVLPFRVTIPAGTLSSAPYVQAIDLDGWTLQRIDLDVPPGPAGLMGFQIYNNGVPWLPYGTDEWIVWDDVKDSWYLEDQPNAAGWEVHGYNDDTVYDHAVTVRCHVAPATTVQPSTVVPPLTIVNGPLTPTVPVVL